MKWNRRHVLDTDDWSRDEIETVLDQTRAMIEILQRPIRRAPPLRGRTVILFFAEASTRTRVSFELAAKALSADVTNITASGSSVEKGESLYDTVRTLQALGGDVVVMRHASSGAPYFVAQRTDAAVINAGDGWHAHPTQGLLDAYTLRDAVGDLEGRRVVIVGDVLHSRVARSDINTLLPLGARITLSGPPTLIPLAWRCGQLPPGVTYESDLDRALDGADAVIALRLQRERQESGLLPSQFLALSLKPERDDRIRAVFSESARNRDSCRPSASTRGGTAGVPIPGALAEDGADAVIALRLQRERQELGRQESRFLALSLKPERDDRIRAVERSIEIGFVGHARRKLPAPP